MAADGVKREDRLREEFVAALDDVKPELIEPTATDLRNGWTAETLTAYCAEQKAAQSVRMNPGSAARQVRPQTANSKYSPFKWRVR